jgi:tetrahydromethanopterin S-methyltransferase subunit G
MDELIECMIDDTGYSINEISDRWVDPFNIVSDIFQYRDLNGQLVPYHPYDYTVDFMSYGFNNIDVDRCVLKSRQIGFSTTAEIESIILAMQFEDTEISFISNQYKNSQKLVESCGRIIDNAKYPLPFKRNNIQKQKIKSDLGTTIVPYSSKPSSIRGDSSIRVYLDEFAFVPDQQDTLDAVEPKLSRGGGLTMMSTPLRVDDLFMQTYNDIKDGVIKGKHWFLPLYETDKLDVNKPLTDQNCIPICPDINIERPEKVRAKSIDRFLQEYMCQPVDEINAYYPFELILNTTEAEPDANTSVGYTVMGLDHALVKDETAIVINNIVDGIYNNIIYVESMKADYHDQLRRVDQLRKQFRVNKIRADATSEMGAQVERDLKATYGKVVDGVKYTNVVKNDMAMRLKYLMQNTKNGFTPNITMISDSDLINQIHGIQVEVTDAGITKYSGKHGGGLDDIVNALWLSIPPDMIKRLDKAIIVKSDDVPSFKPKPVHRSSSKPMFSVSKSGGRTRKTRGQRGRL